jgi:hypothetical protein
MGGGLCVLAQASLSSLTCTHRAFLNKKTWHPGGFKQARHDWRVFLCCLLTLPQQEEVWKREQAKAQEERRLDELKKQIAEEREAQDLQRVAQEAGLVTCVRWTKVSLQYSPPFLNCSKAERLEFMYKGPLADGPMTAMPPRPAGVPAAASIAPVPSSAARALGVYTDDTPKARNEAWARLHGDPMLLVRLPRNNVACLLFLSASAADQAARAELA